MAAKKSQLSATELCNIIKVCGDAQVSELKLGNLFLRFGKVAEPAKEVAPLPSGTALPEIQEKVAEQGLLNDQISDREEDIATLLVTNPYLAEKMISEGELEEDVDTDDPGTDEEA
jgi:hypothetical protein